MDDHLIEQTAERLSGRTEAFECFAVDRRELSVSFEAGRLKAAQTADRGGVGLRVVVGGRLAVGGTPDPTAVERTIDSTIEAAAFGDRCEFDFAPPARGDSVSVYDPAVAALAVERLVADGRRIVEGLADLAPVATVSVGVESAEDRTAFVNSSGQRFDYRATTYSVSASVEFFGDDDIFSVWEFVEGCRDDADLDGLIAAVRRKFEQARTVVPAGPADQPLVFSPHGLNGLLVPLLAGLNGQNVADGVSPLADKLSAGPVVSEKLSLIDDGTLSGRSGSRPFDDEGVPTGRTMLIDAGRVSGFLLDLRTAGKLKLACTANAHRGLTSPPSPQSNNLLLVPSAAEGNGATLPLERLLGEVREGLLVESLLGVGQGNVVGGDFANPIGLAYKIRDGRVVGRVKNCSLAGNVYQDLKKVTAVEDRGHWHGSTCLPHVRIDGLPVAVGQ